MTTRLNEELISSIDDDGLAEIAVVMAAQAEVLRDNAGLARYELTRRLRERGATHLETEHWSGKLASAGNRYTVDEPEELRNALAAAGIDGERLEGAVGYPKPIPPALLCNHRALNDLAKLGGSVKAVIERYRVAAPNEPKLELSRKAEVGVEVER